MGSPRFMVTVELLQWSSTCKLKRKILPPAPPSGWVALVKSVILSQLSRTSRAKQVKFVRFVPQIVYVCWIFLSSKNSADDLTWVWFNPQQILKLRILIRQGWKGQEYTQLSKLAYRTKRGGKHPTEHCTATKSLINMTLPTTGCQESELWQWLFQIFLDCGAY